MPTTEPVCYNNKEKKHLSRKGTLSRKSALLGGVFSLLVGGLLFATPASAMTLQEALTRAYQNNPTIEAERQKLNATDEGMAQARSGWRPSVIVSGNLQSQKFRYDIDRGPKENDAYGAKLRVQENLYQGGKTVAQEKGAKAQIYAERAALRNTEQTVLLAVVQDYMDVLSTKAVSSLRVQNEKRLTRQLEQTKARYEVGDLTITDVSQARASLANARAATVLAKGDYQTARARFSRDVGASPENLNFPKVNVSLPKNEKAVVEAAVTRSPLVVQNHYLVEAAKAGVDMQFADLLPTVDLIGEASHNQNIGPSNTHDDGLTAMLQVSIPIYQKGANASKVREAKYSLAQQRELLKQTRRSVTQKALAAWYSYQASIEAIASIKKQVAASRLALEGVREENLVGVRTVLDVLNAENDYLQAQVNLVQRRRDEVVARYGVLDATGGLTVSNVKLPVVPYNVMRHYDKTKNRWFGVSVDRPQKVRLKNTAPVVRSTSNTKVPVSSPSRRKKQMSYSK